MLIIMCYILYGTGTYALNPSSFILVIHWTYFWVVCIVPVHIQILFNFFLKSLNASFFSMDIFTFQRLSVDLQDVLTYVLTYVLTNVRTYVSILI